MITISTRSCIAQKDGDSWRGVYHHSDGYPSGLGCYIFRLIHREFQGNMVDFLQWALLHDGGWSHIFPSATIGAGSRGGEVFDNTDPQPQCFCHGYFAQRGNTKPGDGGGIHTREEHGFDLEWVYVLDPEARTITVFEHTGEGCPDYARLRGRQASEMDSCLKLVAVVPLDGPEPDWWEMEKGHFTPEHLANRKTWVDTYLPPHNLIRRR